MLGHRPEEHKEGCGQERIAKRTQGKENPLPQRPSWARSWLVTRGQALETWLVQLRSWTVNLIKNKSTLASN